ncbi:hypothetical protein TNCV_2148021 [Trichonephila clavipes]|uniref:DUF5641 domain-containing protein n=1 Tax=Trichonephila clavipes TaxID=2585209 RepID=A0A8X6VS32_TRICX|nr:hypothetical protein TNCV_2148021 [Trichonephila clavipes]
MVLIKDDNLPVNKWSLGRITKLVPGTDGKVRVVEIKTNKGNIKRSIGKYFKIVQMAQNTGIAIPSDDVQELLDSHTLKLTIDQLVDMHEQDIEELESLNPVQSEN